MYIVPIDIPVFLLLGREGQTNPAVMRPCLWRTGQEGHRPSQGHPPRGRRSLLPGRVEHERGRDGQRRHLCHPMPARLDLAL